MNIIFKSRTLRFLPYIEQDFNRNNFCVIADKQKKILLIKSLLIDLGYSRYRYYTQDAGRGDSFFLNCL